MDDDLAHPRDASRPGHPMSRYSMGRFDLDPVHRVLSYAGMPVNISPTLFDTLLYLVENPNRVVTKHELLDAVWPNKTVEEANVSQTIFALRKALASSGATETLIVTAPGKGYRLAIPVEDGAEPRGDRVLQPVSPQRETGQSGLSRRRIMLAGSVSAAVMVVFAVLAWLLWPAAARPAPSLIVLSDFENLTGDGQLDKALAMATQVDLRQSPDFRVLPDEKVADTLGFMARPANTPITPAVAREICVRNNGQAMVGGTVSQVGDRYLLTVTATDCNNGDVIVSDKREVARRDDLLPGLDDLVSDLRGKLGEASASIQRYNVPIQAERTASLEALKAYSDAIHDVKTGKRIESLALFQRAITLDPHFAMAYADLATQYTNLHQGALAAAAMQKAYDLRAFAGTRDGLVLSIRYNMSITKDEAPTLTAARTFTELYPGDPFGWRTLSNEENWYADYQAATFPGEQAIRLEPDTEAGYVNLARAYLHDGQLREAAVTCDKGMARHVDGDDLHGVCFEVDAAQNDGPAMARELDWAKGKPGQLTLLLDAGQLALSEGRVHAGLALFAQALALGKANGMSNFMAAPNARLLNDLGFRGMAMQSLSEVPAGYDSEDYRYTLDEIGDADHGQALLQADLREAPSDTLLHSLYSAEENAALAMRHGHLLAAISDLNDALPYDLHTLDTPYARGEDYLAASDGKSAAAEFEKIIDHRYVEPLSEHYPLAYLGLARAFHIQGNEAASRTAYQRFFNLWKDADPNIPVLLQAKAEYAAERGQPTT